MATNGLNRFEQIGFLAEKAELKVLPNGEKVANFRVITNEYWFDKDQKKQERAEGFRYEVWGDSAENFQKIMDKGGRVYIESSLQNHKYTDEATQETKYRIRFVVRRWLNLDRNESGEGSEAKDGGNQQ